MDEPCTKCWDGNNTPLNSWDSSKKKSVLRTLMTTSTLTYYHHRLWTLKTYLVRSNLKQKTHTSQPCFFAKGLGACSQHNSSWTWLAMQHYGFGATRWPATRSCIVSFLAAHHTKPGGKLGEIEIRWLDFVVVFLGFFCLGMYDDWSCFWWVYSIYLYLYIYIILYYIAHIYISPWRPLQWWCFSPVFCDVFCSCWWVWSSWCDWKMVLLKSEELKKSNCFLCLVLVLVWRTTKSSKKVINKTGR